jgi:hypothetical protein
MTVDDSGSGLHVPARHIPVPTFLSPEAQAVLGMGRFERSHRVRRLVSRQPGRGLRADPEPHAGQPPLRRRPMIWPIPICRPCSATSARASRPPSWPRAPGTCSSRTPSACTGPCALRTLPLSFTSLSRPPTVGSSGPRPKTRHWPGRSVASATPIGRADRYPRAHPSAVGHIAEPGNIRARSASEPGPEPPTSSSRPPGRLPNPEP